MKKTIKFTLACGLILSLGACSSHKTTEEGEASPDGTPAASAEAGAEAGTDAVPQANAENPPPPAADGAPPPVTADAGAPPPAADPALATPGGAPPAADAGAALAATPPPAAAASASPSMADTSVPSSPAGSGSFDEYKVQPGDTLMKVAFDTYGDLYRWKGILEANKDKVTDPNHIPVGTVLKVEKPATAVAVEKNGEKYMIKTGDTLGTISKDVYGTQKKWKSIWENNKQMIHDPNRIFAGFYLYYQPDGSSPKPSDSPTTSPQPLANTGAGNPNTATTTGDQVRTPASADGASAPPAGTVTQ